MELFDRLIAEGVQMANTNTLYGILAREKETFERSGIGKNGRWILKK
jgi:hypothetical protein